jgi:hypothetical protein
MTIVSIAAVTFAVAMRGPQLSVAFAVEDALAALKPAAGQVVHIKTRTFAQNHGDAEPVEDGTVYEESWIDFERNVQRQQSRVHATDELLGDAVYSAGRIRYVADDPETPEPTVYASEMYAPVSVGGLTFWAYSYLPDRVAEGKVVGEVVRGGERCWDVRWVDSQDSAGNKMNARALFRQPDYRPLLVERDYPGGAVERWEVTEWSVVDRSAVPSGTFDPSSIGTRDMPERQAWYADDLPAQADYPVFWAGDALGKREILGDITEPTPGDVVKIPYFTTYLRFDQSADAFLGGNRTAAEYWHLEGDEQPVTISSGARVADAELVARLRSTWDVKDVSTRESALGTAVVGKLDDSAYVAVIQIPESTVIVEAPDSKSLDDALERIRRVE